MKKLIGYGAVASAMLPALAFAQNNQGVFNTQRLTTLVNGFQGVINSILAVLFGVAVVVFIFGIIRFVLASNDPEKRKDARNYMIYAVIAFAVIAGIYGLSGAVLEFFGISQGGNVQLPQVPTATP